MTEKDNIYYLYPVSENISSEKTLRILPPKIKKESNITYAEDYVFEKIIKDY